jgi:hypothetical protein
MLGAGSGVHATEDGHLTLFRAHGAFEGACQEWLLLAAAVANHPIRANGTAEGQGPCIERGPRVKYLHDCALIYNNLGPTVAE